MQNAENILFTLTMVAYFAAMAGYDPRVAVTFWQRMASVSSGSSSIFSDHPSDAKRVKQIQNWLPEALKYYQGK